MMHVSRREIIGTLGCYLAATGATCASINSAAAGYQDLLDDVGRSAPGGEIHRERTESPDFSIGEEFTCAVNSSKMQTICETISLRQSSRNQLLDQLFTNETKLLRRMTRLKPAFAFFDDSEGPNAFASGDDCLQPGSDGSIIFGLNLLGAELAQGYVDPGPVLILVHEWGHIAEFATGNVQQTVRGVKHMELLSDLMAGWYLGAKLMLGAKFDIFRAAESLFSKGDYNFNDVGHHGTPDERVRALDIGLRFAQRGEGDFWRVFEQGLQIFPIKG